MPSPPAPSILLLDGGLGTTLQDLYGAGAGASGIDASALWSSHPLIADPSTLRAAHAAFAHAGADILLTATYQASVEGFARTKDVCRRRPGQENERVHEAEQGIARADAERYMRSAIPLAQEAFAASNSDSSSTHDQRRIALSLGAYGAVMVPSQEYSGAYDAAHRSAAQLSAWHLERLRIYSGDAAAAWNALAYVAFETIPRVAEIYGVRAAMHALTAGSGSDSDGETVSLPLPRPRPRPFWISCVFPGDAAGEELTLPDGADIEAVVRAMLGPGEGEGEGGAYALPYAVGINCTKVAKVPALLRRFERAVAKLVQEGELAQWPALVLYPDGTQGEVYNTSTRVWETTTASGDGSDQEHIPWADQVFHIVQQTHRRSLWSAILVGGCCKAGPDQIRALRSRIDEALIPARS